MRKSYKSLYLGAVTTLDEVIRINNEVYKRLEIETNTDIAEDSRSLNYIVKTKYTANEDNKSFSALLVSEDLVGIFKQLIKENNK